MDEFIAFLVAGLVILAALIVITNGVSIDTAIGAGNGGYVPLNISSDTAGSQFVGMSSADRADTLKTEFKASDLADSKKIELGNKDVYNGLLSGKSSIVYRIGGNINEMKISFSVNRTNSYAPLVIRINGKTAVEKILEPGRYEFSISEGLSDDMLVEIETMSSGIRLWAPSLYGLTDASITLFSTYQDTTDYKFSLGVEYDTFREGNIVLRLNQSIGILNLELNGKTIYSGAVRDMQTLTLKKSDMVRDNNVLLFKPGKDTKISGNAFINIFFVKNIETELITEFRISNAQYNSMKVGIISFDVPRVKKSGGFSVRVAETTYSDFDRAEEKSYTFYFSKQDVKEGTNSLIIKGLDDSGFYVKNIGVKVKV
ncbi:MAG: hypothetical protein V1802_02345 [Candidatus Aenigmatarchaeota archaeon]